MLLSRPLVIAPHSFHARPRVFHNASRANGSVSIHIYIHHPLIEARKLYEAPQDKTSVACFHARLQLCKARDDDDLLNFPDPDASFSRCCFCVLIVREEMGADIVSGVVQSALRLLDGGAKDTCGHSGMMSLDSGCVFVLGAVGKSSTASGAFFTFSLFRNFHQPSLRATSARCLISLHFVFFL